MTGSEPTNTMLSKLIRCNEFNDFYVRKTDKKFLDQINCNGSMRFPILGKVTSAQDKISW